MSKETLKQFFTHEYEVLKPFINTYAKNINFNHIIDPFAGEGHLLRLVENKRVTAIDIDPDVKPDIIANSFTSIPKQSDETIIITNPPYSHRHILQKQDQRHYKIVTEAGYTDLYEYAIKRVIDQCQNLHMFALIPENFIASRTVKLRAEIYKRIRAIQIHELSTCQDTDQPTIMIYLAPTECNQTDLWLSATRIGAIKIKPDGFRPTIQCRNNYVEFGIKEGQSQKCRDNSILLQATDGGTPDNRIKLMRVSDHFKGMKHFINKISDRAYIQIVPHKVMTEDQINILIIYFNKWVDNWRKSTHGLGLTSFRSNVARNGINFRRKRIDFKLARLIINYIIEHHII